MRENQPVCPYCGEPAKLVSGKFVYQEREDLWIKKFWRCVPCDAHVGCHPGTDRPLGTLAKADLRALRKDAHTAFDEMWKSKRMTRHEAYDWLAKQIGIDVCDCHIGGFDKGRCETTIELAAKKILENRRS